MIPSLPQCKVVVVALVLAAVMPLAQAENCEGVGPDQYLCGLASAEDLVRIPGTRWLVASAFAGTSMLNLVDTRQKSWSALVPSVAARVSMDSDRWGECPGPLPESGLVTHGLHIAQEDNGRSILYAVSHGEREAIEVFAISVPEGAGRPALTWVGCVPTPGGQQANSVAALADGSLLATIPLEQGAEFADAMEGVDTGAVYRWNSEDGAWSRLDATAQPYANGIEVAPDGSVFHVASSGLRRIITYSNTTPARRVGSTEVMQIVPDNLHRDAQGMLVTAGMVLDYRGCNPLDEAGKFDLARYGSCPRPWQVVVTDPATLRMTTIATGEADRAFSNVTMGVVVDDTLWVGTFAGDRIAYRDLGDTTGTHTPSSRDSYR